MKPESILRLESKLNITLYNIEDKKTFDIWKKYNTYGTDSSNEVINLDLSELKINFLDFLKEFKKITHLNISSCDIDDLFFLKDLVSIKNLSLSNNLISDLSPIWLLKNIEVLDLTQNLITDFSVLSSLPRLEVLKFGKNPNTSNSFLKDLKQLIGLDLSYMDSYNYKPNYDFLLSLPKLENLSLMFNNLENISFLKNSKKLKTLVLQHNKISDISDLRDLTSLENLYLSDNQITDITSLEKLSRLRYLDLSINLITDISSLLNLNNLIEIKLYANNISNYNSISGLFNLRKLSIANGTIENFDFLPKGLTQLSMRDSQIKNLDFISPLTELINLDLSYNLIEDISIIRNLKKINVLFLESNSIKDISPLENLVNLEKLVLNKNLIFDITYLLKNNSLKKVELKGNEKIEIDFPREVLDAGWEAIKQYSEESKDEVSFKNVKVLLLGNPNIGKSNLLEYLETNVIPILNDSTHGVRYKHIKLKDINFHIWDFGGQEYFHATHKLFFSPNALNVVLWGKDIPRDSTESENIFFDLNYWLRTIEQLNCDSEKEEVLIIENKIDLNNPINQETILNQRQFSENYKILSLSFANLSLLNLKRTEIFKSIFIEKAENIISKFNYPAFYEVFWRRIQELDKDFVTVEEINNRPHKENVIAALKVFHNMGMLLYFHNLIGEKVFCKPQVLLDLLYEKVLGKEKKDRLTKQEIKESILNNPLDLSLEEVIKLLKHFDLVFEIKDEKDVYFIPQYLKPINSHILDLKSQIFKGCNIKIVGDNYLMSIAMLKIFSKYGNYVSKEENEYRFWRNGIIIKKDDFILMIEFNRENQTIDLYQDIGKKNLMLQKEVVDYILDLPEQDYFPKRNYSNYIETVKKRIESTSIVLKTQSDNSVNHSDFMEYYRKIEEGNHNEFYFEGFKWYSTFFTVQVSIDNEFYINWTSIKENIEIQKVKTFNSDNEEKIENISSFSTYLNIDENNIKEENKLEESTENKSVTNIFNGPTNIGNFGDNAKIDEFKFVNDEAPKVKINSGLTTEEKIAVKKWKANSINIFLISIFLTFLVVLSYIVEFEFLISKESWKSFKSTEWFKWIGLVIAFIWNTLVGKMWYDRKFDPSKENSFIDLHRKKNIK